MRRMRWAVLGLWALCGCSSEHSGHDDFSPGTLQFDSPAYGVGETAGPAILRVTRQGGTSGPVAVFLYIGGGTASGGVDFPWYIDYVEFLYWPDGDGSTREVSIPVFDDTILEGDETFEVILSSPEGGAALGATSTTVITLVDSESELSGSLQFAADSYSASESAGSGKLVVTRTLGSVGVVSVELHRVHDGAPGMGVPAYLEFIADVTWPDGDANARTVSVPIADDAIPEPDETVQFVLISPTGGAALGPPSTAALTILDDD